MIDIMHVVDGNLYNVSVGIKFIGGFNEDNQHKC